MKTRTFSLAEGGPPRLRVEFNRSFLGNPRDTRVLIDDAPVGQADANGALQARLPDGSDLSLRWVKTRHGWELHLLRDGRPVPGSDADPQQRLFRLAKLLYVVAALTVGVSVLSLLAGPFGDFGVASAVEGFIIAALGFFIGRRSRVALTLAIIVFALEIAAEASTFGSGQGVRGIVIHGFLVWALLGGFKEIRALRTPPSPEPLLAP